MTSQITIDEIKAYPPGKVSTLDTAALAALADQLETAKKALAEVEARLAAGLDLKFGDRVQQKRITEGKDTGRVRIDDGRFTIVADRSKRVEWDQAALAAIAQRIREAGDDPAQLDRYETVFVDSITVAGRLCFRWCQQQPDAVSEKTGKPDVRGAYGLLGREMLLWLTHLQHTRAKNIVFVGILETRLDDFNRKVNQLQIDGAKTSLELPGIVDEMITMTELPGSDGDPTRTFVCSLNPWGLPAKDRSGRLDMLEPPHLGRLFEKIRGPAKPASERLEFSRPQLLDAGGTPVT